MVITFTGGVVLGKPVRAPPLFITALPVAMILAFQPSGSALVGAKLVAVFNDVAAHLNSFAALCTGKPSMTRLTLTGTATILGFA